MNIFEKFLPGLDKKKVFAWSFYDFANSAYALVIVSFVFPIYFREVVAGGGNKGDFYWGLAVSLSILIAAVLAPLIGAAADHDNRKARKFRWFVLISVGATALLFFPQENQLWFGFLIFIAANVSFEIAESLYNSFLHKVSTRETVGRVSGLAWGLGYVGALIALFALRPLYSGGFEGELSTLYRLTFPLTALFFLVFSLPVLRSLKDGQVGSSYALGALFKESLVRVKSTFSHIREHKNIGWFVLALYFMNDGLVTLFSFIPIYGRVTIGLSFTDIALLLAIVQIIGFPSAVFFGWLSDKKGPKRILLATLVVWLGIVIGLGFIETRQAFFILAMIGGLVIGSSQAVARSWFSTIVPDEKRFEMFGFNGFASKVAATSGPLIFGIVSVLTGNQRIALWALAPLFLIALIIFTRVKEPKTATSQ